MINQNTDSHSNKVVVPDAQAIFAEVFKFEVGCYGSLLLPVP